MRELRNSNVVHPLGDGDCVLAVGMRAHFQIRASRKEALDHAQMARLSSCPQRCAAETVLGVNIGAVVDQQIHRLELSHPAGPVQPAKETRFRGARELMCVYIYGNMQQRGSALD